MPKEHIQPDKLFASKSFGYTQVVTSPPGKLVFIAGQTGLDENFQLSAKDDIAAQAEQAFTNLGIALEAAGASATDVTYIRLNVAGYKPEHAAAIGPSIEKFFAGSPPAAQTLVGVQALGMPDLLIEIEATAVVSE